MTELKTRRGVALYSKNPFMEAASDNTKIRSKRIPDKSGTNFMITNTSTGEQTAPAGFWQYQEVDKSQFVKLYVNGVKAFAELSSAGTKLFALIYMAVSQSIGKDIIYFSFSTIDQDFTPISEATYARGMRELTAKNFIAASIHQGQFYINPDFVFNGDRLAFVKEYRVKKNDDKRGIRDPRTVDFIEGKSDQEN